MNTLLSIPRVALMALALGTAGVTATFAQTVTTPSTSPSSDSTPPPACTGGGGHHRHHHDSVLSAAEKAQLEKAKAQALASNGSLQSQDTALKQQVATLKGSNPPATKEQWHALKQQKEQFKTSLRAAELLIDPTLGPIFAKLDAAHQGHHRSA